MRGPVGKGKVRATVGGELAVRGTLTFAVERMIGRANGRPISITGLGCHVPERVSRTTSCRSSSTRPTSGSRRAPASASGASPPTSEAMSDIALPGRAASAGDGRRHAARRRPDDRRHGHAGHGVPGDGGAARGRARHAATPPPTTSRPAARASCTRSRRRTGCSPPGLVERALVVGGDVLSRVLDWTDRSTLVLFGDGAGAVVLERVESGGFLGFELGADGARRRRAAACPAAARAPSRTGDAHLKMNGREVFKFATRVMVWSAEKVLARVRQDGRRRRRVRPAPGKRPDHRPRYEEAGLPGGEGGRERRPVRQHVVGLDPARARGRRRRTGGCSLASWC